MNKTPRLSKSGIEYLDYQWGIFSGCHNWKNGICPIKNCWAKSLALRFKRLYPNGFEPTFYPEAIDSPKHIKKPSVIGVGWVGDVIGYCSKISERSLIFQTILQCPQHQFVFLTKNTDKLRDWSPFPKNCWVGITITSNNQTSSYIGDLALVEARVKFLSIEPLLNWANIPQQREMLPDKLHQFGVNWVIIGAQTNPLKLPSMDWVREIMQACNVLNIPIFIKDNILDYCQGELRLLEMRQEMPKLGVR